MDLNNVQWSEDLLPQLAALPELQALYLMIRDVAEQDNLVLRAGTAPSQSLRKLQLGLHSTETRHFTQLFGAVSAAFPLVTEFRTINWYNPRDNENTWQAVEQLQLAHLERLVLPSSKHADMQQQMCRWTLPALTDLRLTESDASDPAVLETVSIMWPRLRRLHCIMRL